MDFFSSNFKMSEEETVALMGAHNPGQASRVERFTNCLVAIFENGHIAKFFVY